MTFQQLIESAKKDGVTLIMFNSQAVPVSAVMAKEVADAVKSGEIQRTKIIDIDSDPDLAVAADVNQVPTVLMVRDDDEVVRLIGRHTIPQLQSWHSTGGISPCTNSIDHTQGV